MTDRSGSSQSISLGVVVRRAPGVTRWAKWSWTVSAVLPGAPAADWVLLREDGEAAEYHAATRPLTLHRTDTEAYMAAMQGRVPSVGVIMRKTSNPERPFDVICVTASAYEVQDYMDNGEDVVELVPMTPGLLAWVKAFCDRHHTDEPFVKRRRGPRVERPESDGLGDARVRRMSDVYRAPGTGGRGAA